MNEHDLLSLLVETRKAQGESIGLLITLNFAMFGASYYYLNHTTNGIKFLTFTLHTLGYIVLAGLFHLHTDTLVGLRYDLKASGFDSFAARAWMSQQNDFAVRVIDWALVSASVFLWLGTAYLVFVWRCPPRPR